MSSLLEKFKNRKNNIKKRIIFNIIEEKGNKKIYHTIIFKHLINFETTKKDLRITFQKFNDIGGDGIFLTYFHQKKRTSFMNKIWLK
ncbi:hypothetical protein [Borreliella valaisiana]|uniref:hypothetical protein n=1 Tax=Borreliella valaisiana TaxID=62088 RepID=UPI003BA0C81E